MAGRPPGPAKPPIFGGCGPDFPDGSGDGAADGAGARDRAEGPLTDPQGRAAAEQRGGGGQPNRRGQQPPESRQTRSE